MVHCRLVYWRQSPWPAPASAQGDVKLEEADVKLQPAAQPQRARSLGPQDALQQHALELGKPPEVRLLCHSRPVLSSMSGCPSCHSLLQEAAWDHEMTCSNTHLYGRPPEVRTQRHSMLHMLRHDTLHTCQCGGHSATGRPAAARTGARKAAKGAQCCATAGLAHSGVLNIMTCYQLGKGLSTGPLCACSSVRWG